MAVYSFTAFERKSAYAQRMKLLCCALFASSAWGSILVHGIGNVVSDGEDGGMTLWLTGGPDFLLTVSTTHLDFGNFLTCTTSCSLGIHAAPVGGWDSASLSFNGGSSSDLLITLEGDSTHLFGTVQPSGQAAILFETYATTTPAVTIGRSLSRNFDFSEQPLGGTIGPVIPTPEPSVFLLSALALITCAVRHARHNTASLTDPSIIEPGALHSQVDRLGRGEPADPFGLHYGGRNRGGDR